MKIDRVLVHSKYNGKCAYCGKDITVKDMQVDHVIPKRCAASYPDIDINGYDNLNPSCRRCNHYKRAEKLEQFRITMKTLHERVSKIYIAKVGIDYGIVTITPFDGLFHFEKTPTP